VDARVNLLEDQVEQSRIRREHSRSEAHFSRVRNHGSNLEEFEELGVIGKGSSGVVTLVRWKATGAVCAMKRLRKADMKNVDVLARAWVERHVLAEAEDPFLLQMQCAFQDETYLYLVIEFLAGGDLMSLLIREKTLSEDQARFYAAEMIRSIDAVHRMGFIHRDIKPDNLLLDDKGHLKVADFGLCKALVQVSDVEPSPWTMDTTSPSVRRLPSLQLGELHDKIAKMTTKERIKAWRNVARDVKFSAVGSPNYVAYEVLTDDQYGEECDWWSVGAVLYEMIIGHPPFLADSTDLICRKIVNFEKTLEFPADAPISPEAEDLIRRLLCDQEERLGSNGIDDFKSHPFFKGIDWNKLREQTPPFVPQLTHSGDLKYFDLDWLNSSDELETIRSGSQKSDESDIPGSKPRPRVLDFIDEEDLPFVGFGYRRYQPLTGEWETDPIDDE